MTAPHYEGLQRDQIPELTLDEGRVRVHLVAGQWAGKPAPIASLTDVQLSWITFQPGGRLQTQVPTPHNIFLYVVRGEVKVNGQLVSKLHLAEFNHDGEELEIQATTDSLILLGHAQPYGEPIVANGPFVMNTDAEIHQAYADYQAGKFGAWRG
jgi:redox-sensitive bicupin YhaK (pirin superfamily)